MARKKSKKADVINAILGDEVFKPIKAAQLETDPIAKLLNPRQVAGMLFISTRTLARWAVAFHQALSETASRKGRKRYFTSADIQQLQKAQKLLDEGIGIEETAKLLPVIDPDEAQQTALVLSPEHAYQLGQLVTQSDGLVREVDRLRTDNEKLRRDKDDITYRLERLERQAEWRQQPVWKRIFKPPDEWAKLDEKLRSVRQEQRSEKRTVENWSAVQQEEDTNEKDDNPTDTDQ